jgi:multidrug efflux pump subunit AcrB
MILLTLGGIASALSLPVSLFPQIDYPRVVVSIDAGERDAAQMEAQITRPMEIALRGVPGVTRIRSTTSRGSAEIQLNFSWGANMPQALLATEGALATIQPDLPTGTRYSAYRADLTVFPVYGLALTSEALDQEALRQIAELKVRPALTGITGVAEVKCPWRSTAHVRGRYCRLEQKPRSPFGFVYPDFEQACCSDIVILSTERMCSPHFAGQLLVVVA